MKAGLAIEELAAEIMRQNEIKEDYVVNSQSLLMESYDAELFLRVMDADGLDRLEPLAITDNAHRQIGARLGIPSKYYSRMLEEGRELLTQNVNYWFRQNPEQRMLRVMEGKVRAFLSNRYLRIDNHEVVCAVMPVIGEIPNVQFASNQITENHLFMKVVNPNMQREISPGKTVQAGMVVCNSETGLGTFYVSPMIYCPELEFGMITDIGKVKRTHSGPTYRTSEHFLLRPEQFLMADDNAFLERIRSSVRDALDEETFEQTVSGMQAAIDSHINEADVPYVVNVAATEFGITEAEEQGVLQHLMESEDMTRFGLASAVTRQSMNSESYERATDLEEISYRMLTMPTSQWERMNNIAA